MKQLDFTEWLGYWGDARLQEVITSIQRANSGHWEKRNDHYSSCAYPAWELCLGSYWQESLDDWHRRWRECGGQLHEGRMIAVKWDNIWERLSSTFTDGLGNPYPPYARSSCAFWKTVDQDETIVVGAISEAEFAEYTARFPRKPLLDKDGKPFSKELIQALFAELGEDNACSRAQRVALKRKRHEESIAQAQAAYEQRNRDIEERNAMFCLLERIETHLKILVTSPNDPRWEWLCNSVNSLVATPSFDSYPKWRARAWLSCANLHQLTSDFASELLCLQHALSINEKLPIKRRIKMLQTKSLETDLS